MKTKFALCVIICLVFGMFPVNASSADTPYLYSHTNQGVVDVAAPHAYIPEAVLTGKTLGVPLSQPEDLFMDKAGNYYICDAGENCVYQFDPAWKLVSVINSIGSGGSLSAPTGIFVDDDGDRYIADSGNKRVVVLNAAGELIDTIENPQETSDILDSTFVFVPLKLVVDSSDRLFVLCKDVLEGIMQFSPSGQFIGYMGSNNVTAPLVERLWKTVLSNKQKSKMVSFVPVEYMNISLDQQDFIYAVTAVSSVSDPIRRLNMSGNDVLVRNPINGTEKVVGDELYVEYSDYSAVITGQSSFTDITSDEYGNYYALDGKRGRVFAYDEDGNLLFEFGALGTNQKGAMDSPAAIQYAQGNIYVLDRALRQVIRFEPTEYALLIHEAMKAYQSQEYEKSVELWQSLLKENSYFDLAYVKTGYGLYRLKRYQEAMQCFKIANEKVGYAKAATEYKTEWLNKNFDRMVLVVLAAVLAVAVLAVLLIRRRRRKKR